MGRKIPGKKHRGVKDPLEQHARRQAELEGKVNAAPKNADEQAIPRSLERVIKLKEAVKSGRIATVKKKKKKKKNSLICVGAAPSRTLHPNARVEKVVPVFQQRPGESAQRFLHRVGVETHAFLNETAFEKKYGVQVNRNPVTGKIEDLSKCKKSEANEFKALITKHKNIKKKKNSDIPTMTKAEKRKEKLRLKKEKKKMENEDKFNELEDKVQFGEVVHEPPHLKTRPKKADSTDSTKPGKKSLLLHSLLTDINAKSEALSKSTIDRSGKRKNLPVGERRQLEKQQSDIIATYRKLKAQRSLGKR